MTKSERSDPILVNAETPTSDLGAQGVLRRPASQEPAFQMPEPPGACWACGEHHGSVQGELRCLRQEITRLRGKLP